MSLSRQRKIQFQTAKFNFPVFYFSFSKWIELLGDTRPPFHFNLTVFCKIFRSLMVEWIKARSTCKSLNMTFSLNPNQSPQSHRSSFPIPKPNEMSFSMVSFKGFRLFTKVILKRLSLFRHSARLTDKRRGPSVIIESEDSIRHIVLPRC